MKFLAAFGTFIAVCAVNAIPQVPGDNSHYVEGESRYIWMSGSKGTPVLVDLEEPVDEELLRSSRQGSSNQYWLYTRLNPRNHQLLVHGDTNSVLNSNFHAGKPIKVIVHGWSNSGHSEVNTWVRDAFLAVSDCNVIVVDWSQVASSIYAVSVIGVPSVGEYLGNFLIWLRNNFNLNWNNIHLVGHSLGAHIVGNAGRTMGRHAARITGLDPAGPLWGNNNNALNQYDAQYVEVIHTDGGLLGINDPIGGTNFYPNGGKNPQPGCWLSTCSHDRTYEFFAATIHHNHLVGRLCNNLSQANNNQCSGRTLHMGNAILNKRGTGMYALSTGASWPF